MTDPALASRRDALLRRAFTLSGVLPLGAFLVVHAATNARALAGEAAFARAAHVYDRLPGLGLWEVVFVFAPLLFHSVFGLGLMLRRPAASAPSAYSRALRRAMGVTGLLSLAFLAMHLPELRFRTPGIRPDGGILLTVLAADLSSMSHGLPWRAAAYLLGAGCVCFHFAGGLWGAFAATPRGQRARARRWAGWWAGAVGAVLWVLFAEAAVYHATGARILGGSAQDETEATPCPLPSATPGP